MSVKNRIVALVVRHPKILKFALTAVALAVAVAVGHHGIGTTGERDPDDDLIF